MLKRLINGFLFLSITIGVLQNFLITGLLWNFLFPLILIFTILLFLFRWKKQKSRQDKVLMILLVGIIVLDLGYELAFKERLQNPIDPIELKVMTYNVFFKNKHPKSSIGIIKKGNPDILIVQELTPNWAAVINKKLGVQYPFKKVIASTGTHGIGIYSKYKINNSYIINNIYKKPIAQIVELQVRNKTIQLANVHLASPAVAVENSEKFFSLYYQNYKQRSRQLRKINDYLLDNSKKFDCQFLAGDLNTISYEPILKRLKSNWVDTYREKGSLFKYNFPNSSRIKPILILDYILVRGKVRCTNSKILDGGSSDHLAIMSTFEI